MNHIKTNEAIFQAYMPPTTNALIRESANDTDTKYVTVSAIQKTLIVALRDMLKPLYLLIRKTANSQNMLRGISEIIHELNDGDASLVVPLIGLANGRLMTNQVRDLVVTHAAMVLPEDVLSWAASAPEDAVLIVRDDSASERDVVSIPVSQLDL